MKDERSLAVIDSPLWQELTPDSEKLYTGRDDEDPIAGFRCLFWSMTFEGALCVACFLAWRLWHF